MDSNEIFHLYTFFSSITELSSITLYNFSISSLGAAGGLSGPWLFFVKWFNTTEWDWTQFSPLFPLSHTHTHTHFNHNGVPYVGVVQYTDSSSSRRWDSWSRKEFGDSERLATLTPPWLRDASSPDKAPVSSLWQQQRRQTNSRQESEPLSAVTSFYFSYQLPVFVFFFPPKEDTVPGCVWLSRWRGDVEVLEGGVLGGCAWGCGRAAARTSGWLKKGSGTDSF